MMYVDAECFERVYYDLVIDNNDIVRDLRHHLERVPEDAALFDVEMFEDCTVFNFVVER